MRRTIETAPRDGQAIILEDDAKGTYDVAHWSPEAGEWVGENGEPNKFTPSHWYPLHATVAAVEAQTAPVAAKRAPHNMRRRFGASSITATLIGAAFIGLNFRAEVSAYVTRYVGQQDIFRVSAIGRQVVEQDTLLSQDSRKTDLLAVQQQAEADQARAQAGALEAAQVKQAAEASAPEARQSLEKEQRPEVLANELAETRRTIDGLDLQLRTEAAKIAQLLEERTASTVQHRHALEEERARGAALASELAKARRELETQIALLRKAGDEAVDVEQKPAAVEERPGFSLPAWANSAFVKPAQTAKQSEGVAPENSNPAIKPVETVPLPRERAMSADNGYCSQRYRSYDPASGTYTDYDGRRHSCRSPDDGDCSQRYRSYDPASGTYTGHDGRRHSCR